MMRLTEEWFEACFYKEAPQADGRDGLQHGVPFHEAQGLLAYCPCAYGGVEARAHHIMVPFANPPSGIPLTPNHGPTARGNPNHHPRWTMAGTSLEDLSIAPSLDIGDPGCWHGFITNGHIT